jgi:cytidylate kinase
MPIITISRGCYSHGKEIAERVASSLGYECISKEVLIEASQLFNVEETKLSSSVHDAPGLLERITHSHSRQHFLDYIQTALLEHVKKDKVVYHGLAGHLFLSDISHVVKIRVIAEMEDRVSLVCRQNNISYKKAVALIEAEDHQREEWYRAIYKKDMSDPRLYDMVLHIGRLTIDDACKLICTTASCESFKATAQSQEALNDLALVHHVKAVVAELCEAEVTAQNGIVKVRVKGQKLRNTDFTRPGMQQRVQARIQEDLQQEITELVAQIPGVRDLICDIETPYYA